MNKTNGAYYFMTVILNGLLSEVKNVLENITKDLFFTFCLLSAYENTSLTNFITSENLFERNIHRLYCYIFIFIRTTDFIGSAVNS